jgi:uncharacterized protein
MAAKFEISKDHAGKFRFHLKAPNGEIIAASQGYETKANAEKGMAGTQNRWPVPVRPRRPRRSPSLASREAGAMLTVLNGGAASAVVVMAVSG